MHDLHIQELLQQLLAEVQQTAVKVTIGTSASIYSLLDMPLSKWVAILTFIYMLCQIVVIAPKVIRTVRQAVGKKKEEHDQSDE